jgi:hypothetical protein
MSVASHLNVSPADYDVKIRALIPLYDELIPEAAAALRLAAGRSGPSSIWASAPGHSHRRA